MPNTTDTKVWLITGCSTGFGRELACAVLERGDRAVVTARRPETVADIVVGHEERALVHRLDVTVPEHVNETVAAAESRFGRIDVLVNNAGVGYFGSFEESDEAEVGRMFEINVHGLVRMTRAVLPGMRARRSGHIVNISSIGGLRAFPALSFYHATKFAVVGLSESLAQEVEPLGIKVTIVGPSGFRTDWAGRSASEAPMDIPEYAGSAYKNQHNLRNNSGKQPGDPVRAAAAIIEAVESSEPPLHLLLGKAAVKGARWKIEMLREQVDRWERVSVGADFPE